MSSIKFTTCEYSTRVELRQLDRFDDIKFLLQKIANVHSKQYGIIEIQL